jgi:hypothetical protein
MSEQRMCEDEDDHVTDGSPCWCNPTFQRQDNGVFIVIHREERDAAN